MITIKITKEKIIIFIILLVLCVTPFLVIKGSSNNNKSEINSGDVIQENTNENTVVETPMKPTFYDTYSPREIEMLFGVVEAETIGCEFDIKCNVVSVIFNRVESPRFKQNTLTDVLLAPNQFSVVKSGAYKTVEVTQDTIDAVEYVFEYGDTAADALFFESMKSNVHGSYATYIFNDGKHKFYK